MQLNQTTRSVQNLMKYYLKYNILIKFKIGNQLLNFLINPEPK